MSDLPYKPTTKYAFVHSGTVEAWAQYLFDSPESARAFGGQWLGRVVRVEISAVEAAPETGSKPCCYPNA